MWMLTVAMIVYGLTLVGVSCFLLGRATATKKNEPSAPTELPLSEQERKTLRELRNFLQYDGFSQP